MIGTRAGRGQHGRAAPSSALRLWAGLVGCLLAACAPMGASGPLDPIHPTEHSPWVPAGYRLIWNDEFWSLRLDPFATGEGVWTDHIVGSGERYLKSNGDDAWHGWDGNRGRSQDSPVALQVAAGGSIVNVADGSLHLWGRPLARQFAAHFDGKAYAAALVTTEKSYGWKYGYVEIRARLPAISKGHHFALWMLPQPWDWHQEVDIVEVSGRDPYTFQAAAHEWGEDDRRVSISVEQYPPPNGAAGWHTFGLIWTPRRLIWTVDGKCVKQVRNFVDRRMFLLASWEIDTRFSGTVDSSTVWPAQASLDYVRVYQPHVSGRLTSARDE